jgi:hypothetical protein
VLAVPKLVPAAGTPPYVPQFVVVVAVVALPEVFWLPAVFTPGKSMLAVPLNETPPMLRAVCKAVAVAALPEVLLDVVALPDREAVMVPALKLPEPSRATMAPPVLAFVAFDVTVNVELPDWLAVKVAEPDRPVPETAIDSVPLLTFAAVVAVLALPFNAAVMVPAVKLPEASRATIADAVFKLVAVVAALGMLVDAVNAPVPLPYT